MQCQQGPPLAGLVVCAGPDGSTSRHYPDYTVAIVLHSHCVQWMEKAVDNCVQRLCCNAFKIVVIF